MSYKKPPVTPSESQVSFRQFDKPSLQSEDLSLKPNHLQFPRNKAVSLLSLLLFVCFILGRKDGVGGGGRGVWEPHTQKHYKEDKMFLMKNPK